jgi:Flp pilus assembly protein TadD
MRLNPSNAKAHGNAGLVLMERGEFDAAAAAFREALRLNPADDLARRCLDDIDAARGRRK